MRNVLAFAAGVQKTAYWDLWHDTNQRDDVKTLLYGKLKLVEYRDGLVEKRYPTAEVFRRMAAALDGVESVRRIPIPERESVYLFEVTRRKRGPLYVAWDKRDAFTGEESPAVPVEFEWRAARAKAVDALGQVVTVKVSAGRLNMELSVTPVLIDTDN